VPVISDHPILERQMMFHAIITWCGLFLYFVALNAKEVGKPYVPSLGTDGKPLVQLSNSTKGAYARGKKSKKLTAEQKMFYYDEFGYLYCFIFHFFATYTKTALL
jgi:hypothetical protein